MGVGCMCLNYRKMSPRVHQVETHMISEIGAAAKKDMYPFLGEGPPQKSTLQPWMVQALILTTGLPTICSRSLPSVHSRPLMARSGGLNCNLQDAPA